MGKLAFLFAGQGAQSPGMGKSLYDRGGRAKAVFEEMETQRPGTMEDCFSGTAERLTQTAVTQPCVYAVDLAAAGALAEAGVTPDAVAGFSLGEMAALTFAGAFSPEQGAGLVIRRGALMEQATAAHPGGMAAVLRLADDKVESLAEGFPRLWPVNYNCPGQLVVAGDAEQIPAFCAAVKEAGGMAKPLAVGGAFHTPFMEDAAKAFAAALEQQTLAAPGLPVYANLTAAPYGQDVAELLGRQMTNPVRWTATIQNMAANGITTFVEVGPGRTLSGFVKRIAPDARILNVQDAESLDAALEALKSQKS